ncbi:histidine ammonia-lyase [Olivibacter sp. SDN3]|uniref:histidine ammonia-lyase n=1 Tax=Olivibacter sp. SDN3 TaxID=2764720 RepID=UPI001650EB9C|nr:histidine ammonia-lyase [Olivibacter sp. SDN3]QNL48539.1 histidine ammonia-lyase [Olivibacter sp. SDN3]
MVFKYGIDKLTSASALAIASGSLSGVIDTFAMSKVKKSCSHIDEIVNNEQVVYGVNTGFGPLCDTKISAADTTQLQHNLLKSHAVGVGNLVSPEISKTMLIIKLHALCMGYSGIRPRTIARILWMIDHNILPCVPEQGSVGASGDLAPLSHLFLPLIGLGEVYYKGQITRTEAVLKKKNLEPLTLGPKEGLALINGTQFIAAHAVQAIAKLHNLLDAADIIGAMSLEGLMGSIKPFDPRLHHLRPFQGNQYVANRLWTLLKDSAILQSHVDCKRVQDPYSLRCMPQVHGASRTAWLHLKQLLEIELNAVTDNPIILGSRDTISGGNFHGQPLAIPLDYVAIAAAELGNISDRRSYLIIEGRYGLPKLLIQDAGLNSGFMIPQYTTAALVSENKGLCFPASADSIPTSLGQEDHVSMGSISGRKLNRIIDNLQYILAVELLYATQALDFRHPLQSTPILQACHREVRKVVSYASEDRIFAYDINALKQVIANGVLVNTANQAAKDNQITLNKDEYEQFRLS